MSNGLLITQDIALKSCKIVGVSGQPIEFKDAVVEFNYFEDIFNDGITGNLLINDSMGYINILQLQGFEMLILELDKPGLDKPIVKNFRIYTVTDRVLTKSSNENYVLRFCSEEWLINEQYRVSKSYKQTKISDIVKDILINNLKINPSKIFIEETSGLRDLIIPNLAPIQAINWLAEMAISADKQNIGAPYQYFEDKNGYHFKSILTLFKQNPYRSYSYDVKGLRSDKNPMVSDMNKELVNVMVYEHLKNFDALEATGTGMFANKVITVDPLRLKYGETSFDYSKYVKNAAKLDQYGLQTSSTNRLGHTINETPGKFRVVISTTGQSESKYFKDKNITIHENKIEQITPFRDAQIMLMSANRMKLVIPGDPDMTIGLIINFNLPDISHDSRSKSKKLDDFYSGRYLVTAVRHIFNQDDKFFTAIEICKDTTGSQYADFDNKNPAWKGVR